MIALLLTLFALAQESEEPAGPPPGWVELTPVEGSAEPELTLPALDDEVDYEVTVWGEHAVRRARVEVVRVMEAQGWEKVRVRDGVTIFKGPRPWMGRARLYRDGRFDFSQPLVVANGPQALSQPGSLRVGDPNPRLPPEPLEYGADIDRLYEPGMAAGGTVLPSGAVGMGFLTPSKRKVVAAQARVLEAVHPALSRYRAVVRETAYQEALDELPARLDALWERGEPLEGSTPIEGWEARRQAVLHHWATRADTPEGDGVRRAIALWLRETVMDSAHPVTAEERAAAEEEAGRHLEIDPAG